MSSLDRWGNAVPRAVVRQRCLPLATDHPVECGRCVKTCPHDAITLGQGQLTISLDSCVGCGICSAVCPTDAIGTPWSEETLVRNLLAGEVPVEVHCPQATSAGGTRVDVCLGALSATGLVELGLAGAVRLQVADCESCPVRADQRVAQNVERAAAIIETTQDADVEVTTRHRRRGRRPVVADGLAQRYQRRRMLPGLAQETKRSADQSLRDGDRSSAPTRQPPAAPKRLAAILPPSTPGRTPVEWPAVSIAETCTLCGTCSLLCPTTALASRSRRDRAGIWFTPGDCVSCGRCVDACPVGAVGLSTDPCSGPFVEQPVRTAPLQRCESCSAPTTDGRRLCEDCHHTHAGRMADVLRSAADGLRKVTPPRQRPFE